EPARPAGTIIPAVNAEAMEMGVAPSEGDLDDVMELGDGTLAADQDPSPDHGADLADPDVELVDGRDRLTGHGPGQRTRGLRQESAPGLARSLTCRRPSARSPAPARRDRGRLPRWAA